MAGYGESKGDDQDFFVNRTATLQALMASPLQTVLFNTTNKAGRKGDESNLLCLSRGCLLLVSDTACVCSRLYRARDSSCSSCF